MSKPPNILAEFNTYQYHHILIACEGYNTAAALSKAEELSSFQRPPAMSHINKYEPILLDNNPDQQFVVLIDTRVDVGFSLKSAKWQTWMGPNVEPPGTDGSTGLQYSSTIETTGELSIFEPYGIDFYQVLAESSRKMQRDMPALVYVLKTVFIGHSPTGTEVISNVRPFVFVLYDITSKVTNAGTHYALSIMGHSNGLGKMPQHAAIGNKISLSINRNVDTVGTMMAKLETTVNKKYQKYKKDLFEQLIKKDPSITVEQLQERYQEVRYTFGADAVYHTPQYRAGTTSGSFQEANIGATLITSGADGDLDYIIQQIISSCQQCDDDGVGKNDENQRYFHRIVSRGVENPQYLEVRHEIHRFKHITQERDGEPFNPELGEFIEFDYIYTGKNVDILEFDMDLKMGTQFLYTVAQSTDIPLTQAQAVAGTEPETGSAVNGPQDLVDTIDHASGARNTTKQRRSPLYLGADITDPFIRNKLNPMSAMSYTAALQYHAGLEHYTATLKIIGNPNLLDEIIDTAGANALTRDNAAPGQTGAQDVTRTPALCKVNVKFPNSNEFNLQTDADSGLGNFWYQGFYGIMNIENTFESGQFIQVLKLYALPVVDGKDLSGDPSTNQ